MGKKLKKKARSGQKNKTVSSPPPKVGSSNSAPNNTEPTDQKVGDRKTCSHLDKGVDLDKLSAKLGSSSPLNCEDCREGVGDRRVKSGKGKHGKNKDGVDPKSESKKIWICLACGHLSCGGVGLPTKPQTHAVRHSKQNRHPMAVQFENPQLCWCFPCSRLVSAEKSGDDADVLFKIAKMIKTQPSEKHNVDVEDVWFGSGSVLTGSNSEKAIAVGPESTSNYKVRGLVNLGNTCFFNSILQNLLALDQLRDYYGKLDGSVGSLMVGVKKLIGDINPGSGLRSSINPKSFFGSICAKAPQFKGFQQQDSHELLRCLLDGLSNEEASARKQINSSEKDKNSEGAPTFVDAVFGGQLSNTLTCLECGHTSVVYEPFLDLSIPVPAKKTPSRKAQPMNLAKPPKLPPRKSGRTRPKLSTDANALPTNSSAGGKSSYQEQTGIPITEQKRVSSGDSTLLLSKDGTAIADNKSLTLEYNSMPQNAEANKDIQNVPISEDFTWMDFLGDDVVSNVDSVVPQMDYLNLESPDKSASKNDLLQHPLGCSDEKVTHVGHHGQEKLLDAQSNGTVDAVQEDITLENSTGSCSQIQLGDLNLGVGPSGNFSEEETPLMVQDSTVILLPYKEQYKEDTSVTYMIHKIEAEASSSTPGYEQDSMDFDGFGDMFNEPEAPESSSLRLSSGDNASDTNGVVAAGFIGNSSESEPDEVDNKDAPVSVETCLADFTKLELLLKDENGWQCENCSKLLHEERTRLRRIMQNPGLENQESGVENRHTSDLLELQRNHLLCSVSSLVDNEIVKKDTLMSDGSDMKLEENVNDIGVRAIENSEELVLNPVASTIASKKSVVEVPPFDSVESSTGTKTCQLIDKYKGDEPSDSGQPDGNVQDKKYVTLTKGGESEGSEDEKTNSELVKVGRDANKRILISKAPPILTIHLKRFSQDARGRFTKLNGHVKFSQKLNLKPYMDPSCIDREKYKYCLVGIVVHSGSMKGGHYVAYIRGGKKNLRNDDGGGQGEEDYTWYYASDEYVHEVSWREVLSSQAYILFYEQILS